MSVKINPIGSNQTEVTKGNDSFLFSYKTLVAANVAGVWYRTSKKWSVTTSKHINKWLDGINAQAIEQDKLESLFEHVNL